MNLINIINKISESTGIGFETAEMVVQEYKYRYPVSFTNPNKTELMQEIIEMIERAKKHGEYGASKIVAFYS